MKTKIIIALVTLLGLNVISCDNYLKETLVSDVAADTYYTTFAGLDDGVDATYMFMKYVYSNERAYSLTVFGTDTYTNGADGGFKNFNYYDAGLRSDQSILAETWQWCYRGVNQANAVIGRSVGVKDGSAATINIRIAEVRFLRALYMFYLVRQWGSVPMPLTETIGAKIDAPKVSETDIYSTGIIPDLQFAIDNLPNSQTDYGRATKAAAEYMMGLALLTRSYTTYAGATDVDLAITNLSNVIANYGFALSATEADVWNQDKQTPAQGNKEVIFAVQNSTNVLLNSGGDGILPGEGNRGHLYFLMQYDIQPGMVRDIAGGRPFKRFRPTDYLLNLWEADRTKGGNDIDARYDLTYRHVWLCNSPSTAPNWTAQNVTDGAYKYDPSAPGASKLVPITSSDVGKPRFVLGDTAIYIPGPGYEAKWIANSWQKIKQTRYKVFTRTPNLVNGPASTSTSYDEFNFAHTNKFADPRRPTIQWMEGSRDWFIARLAEVYLLRAEAYVKKGVSASAVADLAVVRTRAAKAGQTAAMVAAIPPAPTLDYILDERARETDGEQNRWFDLVRMGKLVSRVKTYLPPAAAYIQDFHVRRPFPQSQLDRTLPAGSFIQNCGYPGGPSCN